MPVSMLLLALVWRYRDRVVPAAVCCAVLVVSKLFLVPLVVWLAVTRRLKTALLAAGIGVVLSLLAWLPIGFATLKTYPSLLNALAAFEETFSYSLTSFALALGTSAAAAAAIAATVAALLVLWAAAVGHRDEFLAFRLAIAASFALSPIVWGHYYVLLAVSLALRWPRLSPVWLAALWIRPDTLALPQPALWIGLALVVLIAQLDLLAPLARPWARALVHRSRWAVGTALVAGFFVASKATAEQGYWSNAPLVALTAPATSSGVASVRVDPFQRQLCWRVWIDGLRPRQATIAVETPPHAAPWLTLESQIQPNLQAEGCTRLSAAALARARDLDTRPNRYRILFTVAGAGTLAGRFLGT
jgi:hypothetical protein